MKLKKKTYILIICIVILFSFSMLGTVAWLTDSSENTSTFSVGTVDIDLNEADIDEDGNTKGNMYKVVPGRKYVKNPTVTIAAGSEESYIRMLLYIHNASAVRRVVVNSKNEMKTFVDMLGGLDMDAWKMSKLTQNKNKDVITYEFHYKTTVSGLDENGVPLVKDLMLEPLFSELLIPENLNSDELKSLEEGGFKIVVEAHAMQQYGFKNAADAWAAFEKEVN